MKNIALKIYRCLAVVITIAAIIYFWSEISNQYWFLYLKYTPTFDFAKVVVVLTIGFGLGALLGRHSRYVAGACAGGFALLPFYTFLFNPYYDDMPRGVCIWMFYIFIGGAISYFIFKCVKAIDSKREDWFDYIFDESNVDENKESEKQNEPDSESSKSISNGYDVLLLDVARSIIENNTPSAAYVQRKYNVGYNRAGRIMEQLEKAGVVSGYTENTSREVLLKSIEELDNIDLEKIFKTKE